MRTPENPSQGELFPAPPPRRRKARPRPPPAWKDKAPARVDRLRHLLSDGQWHTQAEMVGAGGMRYGARLLELRQGLDGGEPLAVEVRRVPGSTAYHYRAKPKGGAND